MVIWSFVARACKLEYTLLSLLIVLEISAVRWSDAMSSPSRIQKSISLDEFLKLPERKPYREFIDGRIEAKVSPQFKHSVLTGRLVMAFNGFAEPAGLGIALPELRCVFDGRAIIPDVVFLLQEHLEVDEDGEYRNQIDRPPDIDVEIISPGQSVRSSKDKLAHSTAHGCPLGWLFDPERKIIEVYRSGRRPERLSADGVLDAHPVLPGFRLTVAEVYEWLKPRIHRPGTSADPGAPSA